MQFQVRAGLAAEGLPLPGDRLAGQGPDRLALAGQGGQSGKGGGSQSRIGFRLVGESARKAGCHTARTRPSRLTEEYRKAGCLLHGFCVQLCRCKRPGARAQARARLLQTDTEAWFQAEV